MKREEMIAKLKSVDIRATPTVITMDMGLQYDYVTAEGAGTRFGGMGNWPVHLFNSMKPEKWKQIRSAIQDGSLSEEHLKGTELVAFIDCISTMQPLVLSEVLKNLLRLPETLTSQFFCLYDTGKWYTSSDIPKFFLSEQEMKDAFIAEYVFDITPWEDIPDDELKEWLNRLQGDMMEFPVCTYDPMK